MTRRPMDGARRNTGDTAEHAKRKGLPATDYGADHGEPIYAPFAGRVGGWWSGTGGNTVQVAGDGVAFIGQHLSSRAVAIGTYVAEGDLIGYVGSTGSATNGPHLHWWIEVNGTRISGEEYMRRVGLGYAPYGSRTPNTSPAGGGGSPIEGDEMSAEAEAQISAIFSAMFGARNVTGKATPLSWANIDGSAQSTNYGVLPIILHNQTLIAQQSGQMVALTAAVNALAVGEGVDPATILAAARDGATQALAAFEIPAVDTSAIVEAVRAAIAEQDVTVDLTSLEQSLAEQFAAVNANVDEIPVGYSPIIKK